MGPPFERQGVKDIVEDALAAAEEREQEATADDGARGEFGPLRVAVVGVGSHGRARLAAFEGRFDDQRLRLGTAAVDAEGVGAVREYPEGTTRLDVADVDLLLATGHVRSTADLDRLRHAAGAVDVEAVTVAAPTLATDAEDDPDGDLAPTYDVTLPLAASRVSDAWDSLPDARRAGEGDWSGTAHGPSDCDPLDRLAGACCVALVETLFVESVRALTPHVPTLPLLEDGGRTTAHLGFPPTDVSPEACARAALDGTLAPSGGGGPDAIVTHVTAGADVSVSFAEALRAAVQQEAPGEPGGDRAHYLGVKPTLDGSSVRRVVVFLVGRN